MRRSTGASHSAGLVERSPELWRAGHPPFGTVLVANRGEIAARVAKTCRRLGTRPVGVYSDDDRDAGHLDLMSDAVHLPGSSASDTYLNQDAVLAAARRTGSDALHPGYGFLSENTSFVERCAGAGLVFVGPSAHQIALMGQKSEAREAFAGVGFPVLEQFPVDQGPPPEGNYPLILKASGGGGGIGMTLVESRNGFEGALARARSFSQRHFGSSEVYAEHYLPDARHVEVQIAGDGRQTVALGARDCSWQRRYQKVVEETPPPGLAGGFTGHLAERAAAAAHELGYSNVGTVECLVSGGRFFFLEMNTRIQVEHPITEATYGIDLVEWQLRIAAGGGLPEGARELTAKGHAMEFRVYAEDPVTGLPCPGTIASCQFPEGGGIRVDTAVKSGSVLPIHFDPMIAKIIVSAESRAAALNLAAEALRETRVDGVKTNLAQLRQILASQEFQGGRYNTASLGELQTRIRAAAPQAS